MGECVAVVGLGLIGLLTVQMARADGTIAGLNAGKRAHLDGRREWHASAIDDATSARHH